MKLPNNGLVVIWFMDGAKSNLGAVAAAVSICRLKSASIRKIFSYATNIEVMVTTIIDMEEAILRLRICENRETCKLQTRRFDNESLKFGQSRSRWFQDDIEWICRRNFAYFMGVVLECWLRRIYTATK